MMTHTYTCNGPLYHNRRPCACLAESPPGRPTSKRSSYLLAPPLPRMCPFTRISRLLSTSFFFFFNDTATTEIYTLSLHDALPILPSGPLGGRPLTPASRIR